MSGFNTFAQRLRELHKPNEKNECSAGCIIAKPHPLFPDAETAGRAPYPCSLIQALDGEQE